LRYTCPAVGQNKVIANLGNQILTFDLDTGALLWNHQGYGYSPVIYENKVLFGKEPLKVLDIETGNTITKFGDNFGISFSTSPSIYNDIVIVPSYDDKVYAFDLDTGSEVWIYSKRGNVLSELEPIITGNDQVILSGDLRGINALNIYTGEKNWGFGTTTLSPKYYGSAIYGGYFILSIDDHIAVYKSK
jgi:outer membrane protein assembly factor BamB